MKILKNELRLKPPTPPVQLVRLYANQRHFYRSIFTSYKKGCARLDTNFFAAIYLAIDTIRRRNRYNYARRNPLRKGYNERGNDNEILAPTPHSEE